MRAPADRFSLWDARHIDGFHKQNGPDRASLRFFLWDPRHVDGFHQQNPGEPLVHLAGVAR